MSSDLNDRKKAVEMYYHHGLNKSEISRRLQRSRRWVDRWIRRYNPDDISSLTNHKTGPRCSTSRWSDQIRQRVIEMRQQRCQRDRWPYALIGAEAIHYELKSLNSSEVPPVRTIHRWLVDAGLVAPPIVLPSRTESKLIPLPVAAGVNSVQQLDLKGPIYLFDSAQKYYLVVLRDVCSHRTAIDVLTSRTSTHIVTFLIDSWKWLGCPNYLQMDNGLEFRGSNRYPRSLSQVTRVAIHLGIEPVFIPPHEPWRNGVVERYNRFLEERLRKIHCKDYDELRLEAKRCQNTCNSTHRCRARDGLSPNEFSQNSPVRLLTDDRISSLDLVNKPNRGFVSFVRRVRKSGRITIHAADRFMVNKDLANTYVLARHSIKEQVLNIYQNDSLLRTHDFSTENVGKAADG